jgi:hypothetical protein
VTVPKALWQWNRVRPADGVHRLNAMGPEELARVFAAICPDPAWVEGMVGLRPFKDGEEIVEGAERLLARSGGSCDGAEVRDRVGKLIGG